MVKTNDFKSFEHKTKLVGEKVAQSAPNSNNGIVKNATSAVPSKYLSNFWRLLEM